MKHVLGLRSIAGGLFVLLTCVMGTPAAAQNRLINMIPQSWSGEQNQDAEPTLAIDPADYSRIAGSAFTWDNLTESPMTTATAPIYVSSDGGATWSLALIVPSQVGSGFPTGDITLSFGSTPSGAPLHDTSWLYGGILSAGSYPVKVLRTQDYLAPGMMTVLDTRTGNVDQPHTRAIGEFGQDKLYVGFNNGWNCVIPGGRTSVMDVSLNPLAASPTFSLDLIEARNTACQDGFAQVAAPHMDGTVYAAFLHDWNGMPRLVVVRDDSWASTATPFSALADPFDMVAGRFVTGPLTLASGYMGNNRLGASNVSIAVDPRDSNRVYVAWGDGGPNSETIHVRRSIDRGLNWSPSDLLTVTNAMNPEVAINSFGTVGVLYQRVVSNRWETHLTRTIDPDATIFDNPDLLLANTSATSPAVKYEPYIGDYASLITAGKNFYGMFSASNYPDAANFLPGTAFQRYVDWAGHTLYADAAHTTSVPVSIDPYFFEAGTIQPDLDFYVRDWTDDATHADPGVEPSTNPVFYATGDVWNRRFPSAGPLVNDQPTNEDAGNGAGNIGHNYAFARVRRNVAGAATAVTVHFLVSKFGTGSNFVDTTIDPDVTFIGPDPVIMTNSGTGPWISTPQQWNLAAISGNHLCLAVEISAAGSPFIPPSLLGSTPGWPTTDLRVMNDNHKAQRNMQLSTTPGGMPGKVTGYGIVHNGALFQRDVELRVGLSGTSKRYVRDASLAAVDQRGREVSPGQTLILHGFQPGENRWVSITVSTADLPIGQSAYVTVDDMVSGMPVSGFGYGIRGAPLASAIGESIQGLRGTATRLALGFDAKASANNMAPDRAFSQDEYVSFVKSRAIPNLKSDLARAGAFEHGDSFGLTSSLAAAEKGESAAELVGSLDSVLNGIDSFLTMKQLEKGDPADIVQMVRWQKQLFERHPKLRSNACATKLAAASNRFVTARMGSQAISSDYPGLVAELSGCLGQPIETQSHYAPRDLAALEKRHREILLELSRR